jgi:ankyrin repeat protein
MNDNPRFFLFSDPSLSQTGVALEVEDNASDDGGPEQSMKTGYHSDEGGGEENMVDVIVSSGIEQRLASLHQRRKQERISQFCSAASRGEIPKLMRTMRNGVHIDETDTNGRTALHCAASEGQLECVRFLLDSSASLNIQDKYKNTPLNDAVRHQHDAVAAELRRSGAASVQLPGYEMGVLMCTFGFEGDKVQLERMLANGVNVNIADYDKRTALHLASSQGHLQVVEYLLERQADVNCTDRLGFSPLVDALRHDRSEVQKLLRSKGGQLLGMEVSVELCNAAAVGDVPRMRALIENGANPNAGDYDSRTALHLAASNGETSALDYILRCIENINVNPLDRLGGTPLDDANRHGHAVAVAMLEAAGGLRHDNDVLKANAETLRSESELLQRQQRSVKVQDLLNASPETKSCSWIKGKCGKLLPNQLNDLLITYKDLKADLTEVTRAMVKFNGYWAGQKYIAQRRDSLKKYVDIARKSVEYNQIVEYAGSLCDSISTWQAISHNALEVMLEDLPHCKSTVIFSKGYREEVKNNLETFAYVRKVLTYLKFLLCKIPEVRMRSEEDDLKREQENADEHTVNTQAT